MPYRRLLAAVAALCLCVGAHADDVTLTWTNPTTWVDGTPLAPTDLKWANVYCGDAAGANYTSVASVDLSTGATSYTFAITSSTTCAVSFVVQPALTPDEIAIGVPSYPIESALSAPVTYAPARVPASSVVTGVVQGPTPMHCTTTTACAVDPPQPIAASVRSR
jgi:hypothetical protein